MNAMLLMMLAASSLVGKQYDTLRGTPLDVEKHAVSAAARTQFHISLNGPQGHAARVNLHGQSLLMFETCEANMCGDQHSVIAVSDTLGEYAATYTDDGKKVVVIPNPAIENLIGSDGDAMWSFTQ